MAQLRNRFNVPSIPVYYTDPGSGTRIPWHTASETFIDFCQRVWAFCDGNNIGRPPESALEEVACAHFPKVYCDGKPAAAPQMVSSGGGCGACGGRR